MNVELPVALTYNVNGIVAAYVDLKEEADRLRARVEELERERQEALVEYLARKQVSA